MRAHSSDFILTVFFKDHLSKYNHSETGLVLCRKIKRTTEEIQVCGYFWRTGNVWKKIRYGEKRMCKVPEVGENWHAQEIIWRLENKE